MNKPAIENVESLELSTAAAGLPEFVDRIVSLAHAAAEPRVAMFRVPGTDASMIVKTDGSTAQIDPVFDALIYHVESLPHLSDIVAGIRAHLESRGFDALTPEHLLTVVEIDRVVVMITPHANAHPERFRQIVCPLEPSIEFDQLRDGLRNADQSKTLAWLRSTLLDYIPDGDVLFRALRDLRFRASVETTSTVGPSRASYGREDDSSVHAGTVSLDQWDTFTVELPLIDDPAHRRRYPVSCFLEVDHRNQTVTIAPRRGSAENAWRTMRDTVAAAIPDLPEFLDSPVVLGTFEPTPRSAAIAERLSTT